MPSTAHGETPYVVSPISKKKKISIMKRIYILLVLFATVGIAKSQIKIGDTTPPESFSILEIDSKKAGDPSSRPVGGLRLPQLESTQLESLKTYFENVSTPASEKEAALGLLVYNTQSRYIEMWNGTKWVALPSNDCIAITTLTLSANHSTIDEYGTEDLVLTAIPDAGVSGNADIVYRWTLNSVPIEGATEKTLTIKKEDLSRKYSGTYEVTAYSCMFSGIVNVQSATTNVTVTPKNSSLSISPTSLSVFAILNGYSPDFNVTTQNTEVKDVIIISDPEHMYPGVFDATQMDPTSSIFKFTIPDSYNRDSRTIIFKVVDDKGNESEECTITQDGNNELGLGEQVGDYFLYSDDNITRNVSQALNHCRGLVWTGSKRTSLISYDFLNDNSSAFETDQTLMPQANYWMWYNGTVTMVNVAYNGAGGTMVLTPAPGTAETNTYNVRCMAIY